MLTVIFKEVKGKQGVVAKKKCKSKKCLAEFIVFASPLLEQH